MALDVFPARVRVGSRWQTARLHVTDGGRAVVWIRGRGNRPEILLDAEPATVVDNGGHLTLVAEGVEDEMVLERTSSCGCGNPLKRMNPARALAAM